MILAVFLGLFPAFHQKFFCFCTVSDHRRGHVFAQALRLAFVHCSVLAHVMRVVHDVQCIMFHV